VKATAVEYEDSSKHSGKVGYVVF